MSDYEYPPALSTGGAKAEVVAVDAEKIEHSPAAPRNVNRLHISPNCGYYSRVQGLNPVRRLARRACRC